MSVDYLEKGSLAYRPHFTLTPKYALFVNETVVRQFAACRASGRVRLTFSVRRCLNKTQCSKRFVDYLVTLPPLIGPVEMR